MSLLHVSHATQYSITTPKCYGCLAFKDVAYA